MAGFGFTPDDGDDAERAKRENENRENLEAMMRQMQEQIKQQFEQLGINPGASGFPMSGFPMSGLGALFGGSQETLPLTPVRDTSKKFITTQGSQPLGTNDVTAVNNACEIADIWLNEATDFPATSSSASRAISRLDWIDETLPGWQATMEPLASGLSSAISKLLDEAMSAQGSEYEESLSGAPMGAPIGAIAGLLRSFIGTMIATQLGQAIGAIATTATGAHDVGLPILQPARSLLIPENIEKWGADTEIAKSEIYLFHALREGAIARLFEHNPWIVSYIRSAIVDYGAGIRIDLDAIQRQAEEAMQGMGSGEQEFTISLDSGMFTPEETPAQRAALEKLETVLALVDGWADDVATLAAGDRIPSITALRELHRRKRATSAPTQQLFKTMLGLEVSPKLAREASAFWSRVREVKDISARDQIWSGILPSATELLAPDLFLASTEIPDDLSGLI